MLTRVASTHPPRPTTPGRSPTSHGIWLPAVDSAHVTLLCVSSSSAPPTPTQSLHLPNCLSDGCLFLRQAPGAPVRFLHPTGPAVTHGLDSPCICPTINKTSQSQQINLLVNGTRPPGLSLLLMSRLLLSFLHRLLPSLSPSLRSDRKEAPGCRSYTIEALRGACDIQSSVAQTDEDKYSADEDLLITNKCCGGKLGGPSSGWQGDESLNTMRATDRVKDT